MPYCNHCGNKTETGEKYCIYCGKKLEEIQVPIKSIPRAPSISANANPSPPAVKLQPDSSVGNTDSYFDGNGAELFGKYILTVLVSAITCGIATPWMLVRIYEWRMEHTVIDGKRQCFNGTGAELFGKWIIWELLSAVTCGIYAWYVPVALQQWETAHTSYASSKNANAPVYERSYFDGTFSSYIGNAFLAGLITAITCGIAYPWGQTKILNWQMSGKVVDGDRYYYDGTGGELFGVYIVNALLSLVTCGIYTPWAICKINEYVYSHTHIVR